MTEGNQIADEARERKYWTQIPNIVYLLGLNPHELALYSVLKMTAGQSGMCWKSTETLAKECGMSAGMVSQCKRSLAQKFDLLNGKPLIQIVERKQERGGRAHHVITIVDIWPENMAHFGSASSPHELASSPHEQASSQGELNKNTIEQELCEQEDEGANAPPAPVQAKQKRLDLEGMPKGEKQKRPKEVEIYRHVFERYPRKDVWTDIAERVAGRLEAWEAACKAWKLQGYKPTNYTGIFDWIDGIPDYAKPNGGKPNGRPNSRRRRGRKRWTAEELQAIHQRDAEAEQAGDFQRHRYVSVRP